MTPEQFIQTWHKNTLNEEAGAQGHFEDLCSLLGIDPFHRYARYVVQQLGWHDALDTPVETLARTDVLHVIDGPNGKSGQPDVSDALAQLVGQECSASPCAGA